MKDLPTRRKLTLDANVFKKINIEELLRSYQENPSRNLKFIYGEAKRIKDELMNPFNSIYDGCTSFDHICQAVEDHSQNKLGGDTIIKIAASVCDAKGICPDDSCYDSKISSNNNLSSIGVTSQNAVSLKPTVDNYEIDDKTWKLFLLTNSRGIRHRYMEALNDKKN